MQVSPQVQLPPQGRDHRLDVLRGIANWAIFLDHIPNNVVNWITTRNYGFADAADLFIFISGYTVAFVYGRMMISRGFIIAGTRIFKRSWQIYVAHLVLFVIYIAEVGYLAKKYNDPKLLHEFNVAGFMQDPAETLYQGLILPAPRTSIRSPGSSFSRSAHGLHWAAPGSRCRWCNRAGLRSLELCISCLHCSSRWADAS